MATDRRKFPRQRCLLGGRILLNGGKSTLNCVIRNQSNGGALLALAEPTALAAEFPLLVDRHAAGATASVVWRLGKHVGVAFREEGALERMKHLAADRETALRKATREANVRRDTGY